MSIKKQKNPFHRLSVDIDYEDSVKLQRILPWGTLSKLIRAFVKHIINVYNEKGALGVTKMIQEMSSHGESTDEN